MNRDHPSYNTAYRQEGYPPPPQQQQQPPVDARFGQQPPPPPPPFHTMNENGHTDEGYNNGPNVTYNSIGLDEREKRYLLYRENNKRKRERERDTEAVIEHTNLSFVSNHFMLVCVDLERKIEDLLIHHLLSNSS